MTSLTTGRYAPRAACPHLDERASSNGSPLGDEMLHAHRLAWQQIAAHALLQVLVGQRGARALVQVVGAGRDDEALDIARRVGQVAVSAREGGAVALARRAQLTRGVGEFLAVLRARALALLDRLLAVFALGLGGD